MATKDVIVSVRLTHKVATALRRMAQEQKRTRSWLISDLLTQATEHNTGAKNILTDLRTGRA